MRWPEFRSLLSGLGQDTPLTRTVQIRLEDDPKVLEHFSTSQRNIRRKWRAKQAKKVTPEEMTDVLAQFEAAFAAM